MTRTTTTTVIFRRPFSLNGFDGEQPAGSYSVETTEELLDGLSFPAYRRVATVMQMEGGLSSKNMIQVAVIDPKELEAALHVDAAHTQSFDEFTRWRTSNIPGACRS